MNKYLKEFFHIGLMFSGFGPVVAGIVYYIISIYETVSLSGSDILRLIVSTYLLAFVHAGASVFNRIDGWSIAKSIGANFTSLYLAYVICYLINSWIPFNWYVVGIFTLIFIAVYLVIWLTVYFIVKATAARLNEKLSEK